MNNSSWFSTGNKPWSAIRKKENNLSIKHSIALLLCKDHNEHIYGGFISCLKQIVAVFISTKINEYEHYHANYK